MYTCSGSEAGDLALRIAKHATGCTGVVVTRNAYHGVTTEMAAISPSLGGLGSLAPWVRWVEAPEAHRVHWRRGGHGGLGAWFAAQVQHAIDDLAAEGYGLAAFIADSAFTSDGVLTDPVGFLAPAVEAVRRAGGLWIADEVQPGFGRTGAAMWGFERHGVRGQLVPDLVTVGKPMGNGMPVAAALMRPEVIADFGREVRYFNTFGGNPVSIAAAQAVLDVLRDEDLQGNAARVGAYLLALLGELAARHPVIADVRGAGLLVGVELERPATGEPDEPRTIRVVNAMRRRRVLLSASGLHNNVLKIRPPLVFSTVDADRLATELDAALVETRG
jgi:4-aminobutyrate aminotransferase-like enzyme